MALQYVYIKRTIYSDITDGATMRQYVLDRISNSASSLLYGVPAIATGVYTAGTAVAAAIQTAITNYGLNETKVNFDIIKAKIALAIIWLDSLTMLVEPIANNPLNCSTREEAAINIEIAGFKAEKLIAGSKGVPDTALFTAEYVGNGIIDVDIANGADFNPTNVIIIAISIPPITTPPTPLPTITLVNGQAIVVSKAGVTVISKTLSGKGRTVKLYGMDTCSSWMIYIYCMNGNKLISLLSTTVPVNLIAPPTT